MIVACTGHRPDKLPNKETGYKLPNPTYIKVSQAIEKHLLELKPEKVISGMALGADSYFANVAIKLKIPFIAAVPFIGQESIWPEQSQKQYRYLIKQAQEVVIVSEGGYSNQKLDLRNRWMVDHADIILAIHDGSAGGTANCIKYAQSQNKQIITINPKNL